MKKIFIVMSLALAMTACKTNSPEQNKLIGTWHEPYHMTETVKTLRFNSNGTLLYVEKPDTTWTVTEEWGGKEATLNYSVQKGQLHFSGYGTRYDNRTSKTDTLAFNYSSGYSLKGTTLIIDSFSYDGGITTQFYTLKLYKR